MNIIEKFIQGKNHSPQLCEDTLLITNDFVAIIDGATSKSDLTIEGLSLGKFASTFLANQLKTIDKTLSATETFRFLSQQLYKYYSENHLLERLTHNPTDRPTAAMIIYSKYFEQVWLFGDCQCKIDNQHYTTDKQVDRLLAEVRSFVIEIELKQGNSIENLMNHDLGREFMLPLLKKQALFQNSNGTTIYEFGVIDGFEMDTTKMLSIDVRNAKTIILASDGYPKLFDTLEETENYLQYVLQNDPLCYKLYKSTKGLQKNNISFDDRTFVKIQR